MATQGQSQDTEPGAWPRTKAAWHKIPQRDRMSLQTFGLGAVCIIAGSAILWGVGGTVLGCGLALICLSIWTLAL